MSGDEGFKRKSTRMAAIEAAKRIKNNANANKLLSHCVKEETQIDESKMVKPFISVTNGHKKKMLDQVLDSTLLSSKAHVMHRSSKKMIKMDKANPQKCEDIPKRGRGRPPKTKPGKCSFRGNASMNYEDPYLPDKSESKKFDDDVNVRRESYNVSLLKSELIVPSTGKQLQLGNEGITYKESLTKFCKDLGPTARKVAHRKLIGQGLNYQARHRLEPLKPSSENQPHPCLQNVNSFNGSFMNQVSQPLMSYGDPRTFTAADYKGKTIMVDDGKHNFSKCDDGDHLELLFGKKNFGVKICNSFQENISLTGGDDGSSENQDFVPKNLGSVMLNYHGTNLIRNITNVDKIELDSGGEKGNFGNFVSRNRKLNSCVYPSTYVQPSRKPPPYCPAPPLQPPQNWCPPPPDTKIPVVRDGYWKEQELQLVLSSYMQMKDQESNVWLENSWVQNQPNQFLQSGQIGTYQQQLGNVQPQQHQVRSYQNLFDIDVSQPQDRLLMSMAPQEWFRAVPKHNSLPFGTQQHFGL